jgi:hypothetical protein
LPWAALTCAPASRAKIVPAAVFPGFVGHHDARIEGFFGNEGKVERCRPNHPDAFDAGYEFVGSAGEVPRDRAVDVISRRRPLKG